jgi:hypothetical protein
VSGVAFPPGFQLVPIHQSQPRRKFDCSQTDVNDWLQIKALQRQDKRLFATKVLRDHSDVIAGFYTLATDTTLSAMMGQR